MSAVRGVRTVRRSCSRIEIGCRSRHATFGPSRLHGEEPRSARPGLATPGESIGVAKARRKPGPRWQSRDTGGGLPPNRALRKRTQGSTCRWKALWAEEAAPFDEDAGESALGAPGGVWSWPGRARSTTESVRGRSPASHAVDNAAAKWHRKFAVALERAPAMEGDRVVEWAEARGAPSSALYPGLGHRKVGWRRSRDGLTLDPRKWSARRKPRAREPGDPRVLVS
jgi:hypothetical protein